MASVITPSSHSSPNVSSTKPMSIHSVANLFIRIKRHLSNTQPEPVNSGGSPETHTILLNEDLSHTPQLPAQEDTFTCEGGVNLEVLLRASRASLLESAIAIGGNALVNERWECIVTPRRSSKGIYKVQIKYLASAARVLNSRDPHKPIGLEKATKIGGLMTILRREREMTV